jgi:hypothetical protein
MKTWALLLFAVLLSACQPYAEQVSLIQMSKVSPESANPSMSGTSPYSGKFATSSVRGYQLKASLETHEQGSATSSRGYKLISSAPFNNDSP